MINRTNFIRDLYNPKKDKVALLLSLKEQSTFEGTFSILRDATKHPLVKSFVFAIPFPKSYDDLRKQKYLPNAGNIGSEIAWILFPIIQESNKINSFLEIKSEYETSFLLGKYAEADEILNRVESEFGQSIWLVENRLLIAEIKHGTEANWLKLSEIIQKMTDGLLLYLTENLSKKIEEKITYNRYKDILINQIDDLAISDDFREYLLFRLNYIGVKQFYNYDFFLAAESTSSLIDRYLLLREVLIEIVDREFRFNFLPFLSKSKQLNDTLLTQLSNYFQPEHYNILEYTERCIELFDLYTQGKYEQCIETLKSEIANNPKTIELYDLYVKSTIELRNEFIPTNISPHIDKILYNLFLVYSKSSETNKGVEELFKIVTINFSADWSKQLFSLINSAISFSNDNITYEKFYLFFSQINNPKSLIDIDNNRSNFNLPKLLIRFPESISLNVLNTSIQGDNPYLERLVNIPISKKNLYNAKSLYNQKLYKRVTELGEEILQEDFSTYVREEILLLLFKSYYSLNEITKALLLFVNTYISNPNLVKRFNSDDLIRKVQAHLDLVSSLIEYPIFCSIVYDDPYEIYVAYDNFLSKLNLDKPSELIGSDWDQHKLIIFFRDVCKFDVLKHSYNFISKEEIENERSLLLVELLQIDKKNEPIYINEITTLSQNAAIKKAIREVDKAKITINVDQLKDAEANNIKEGFNRYIELANFSKNRNIQGVDISGKQLSEYLKNINHENRSKVVYVNDPAFISFKVMFLDIRDKFILSKEYGLDGYLSTRIRHGTFQNYIRSVFESETLISQKNANGDYLDIDYWKDNIPSNLTSRSEEIQKAIHQFSKKIDEYTEFIIKELIQVKTEKHDKKENALFDYSMHPHQLAALFKISRDSITDHKTFINAIFKYLIELTEEILENVKVTFIGKITDTYTQILSEFMDEIKKILGSNSFPNLTSAIMKCNTLIRRELVNISQWFNISNPTSDLLLDINTIIQTSVQITNRIYPYKKINPQIIIPPDLYLKGSINIIYITRILLDNIIQHSQLESNELEIKIEASITPDNYLKLDFTNNFSNVISKEELRNKLEDVKKKWHKDEQDFTKTDIEGGSGFDKIRRIITFDMRNKQHKFDFSIEETTLSIDIFLKLKSNE